MKFLRYLLILLLVFGTILIFDMSGDFKKFAKIDLDRVESIIIFFDNSNKHTITEDKDIGFIVNRLKTYKFTRFLSGERQIREICKLFLGDNNRRVVLSIQKNNIVSISKDGRVYNDFKVTGDILDLEELKEVYDNYID